MAVTNIVDVMERIEHLIKNEKEKALAELVQEYDFVVGSMELKTKLERVLPANTNIIYNPFIEDLTKIYAIKKFDINDFWEEPNIWCKGQVMNGTGNLMQGFDQRLAGYWW